MVQFDWINQFLRGQNKVNKGLRLSNIIPDRFDAYFLVHWKTGIIDNFPFEDYPETHKTLADTNKRIRIERDFDLFLNEEDTPFRPTTLKEIAIKFNQNYDYELLKRIKQTPGSKNTYRPNYCGIKTGH